MTINYEFKKSENWRFVHSDTLQAESVPHKNLRQYYPISDYSIPVPFFSPVVGIYVTSNDDPGTWRKAGFARQISTTSHQNTAPNLTIKSQRLSLRKTTVCFFEKLKLETYGIELASIPFWLRDISFKVWEYTGNVEDSFTNILREDLQVIEDKIDQML